MIIARYPEIQASLETKIINQIRETQGQLTQQAMAMGTIQAGGEAQVWVRIESYRAKEEGVENFGCGFSGDLVEVIKESVASFRKKNDYYGPWKLIDAKVYVSLIVNGVEVDVDQSYYDSIVEEATETQTERENESK